MKTFKMFLCAMAVLFVAAVATPALADPAGGWCGPNKEGEPPCNRETAGVPEFDPASAGAIAVAIGGGALLLRRRRS